jgi:hypothetical protein
MSSDAEQKRYYEERRQRVEESKKRLVVPSDFDEREKAAWEVAAEMLRERNEVVTFADLELIRQYARIRVMGDMAYNNWLANPERITRVVTGIAADKVTPKVTLKENEHYMTYMECDKRMQEILIELKLTPKAKK